MTSSAAWGANVDALDAMARDLNAAAIDLDEAMNHLQRLVEQTDWFGPDSERFRTEIQRHQSEAHGALVRSIRHAASKLMSNASEQRTASAAGGGA
jgi:hypothetical protein